MYKLTRCGISSQKTKTANQYVTRDVQTLLSALSKMSIKKATAEIQTELDKLHEFYQKANKTSITIPEILRIGIYYLAYRYSKEQEISGRSNRISIEKYIEHELGLSKNAFNGICTLEMITLSFKIRFGCTFIDPEEKLAICLI